jgi:allantoicase
LRFRIFPDGGVARLRIHGEAVPDRKRISRGEIDLVAVENGGSALLSSDQHYGAPRNLLMPYPAKNMGDGWETKRRRGPGHDWVILKLGVPGTIHRVEVNTAHFKGNFPDSCSLDTCYVRNSIVDPKNAQFQNWVELLPQSKLKANHRHTFNIPQSSPAATHVRFRIYPDGGVSRLRLFGRAEINANAAENLARFNGLPRAKAVKALLDCCGSKKWAGRLADQRPFSSDDELIANADKIWTQLETQEWLEAFRHQPPIGENRATARQSKTASRWSVKEQSTAQSAGPEVLAALAAENKKYSDKFGFVFLICATGKTSQEILAALSQRLGNNPEVEMHIAAEEQRKITRLRLEKLLNS